MTSPLARPWQSWKHAKGVAALVVLALWVGIGAVTAMYSIVETLLLRPIPFEHGERLVSVLGAQVDDPNGMSALTLPDAVEIQRETHSFDLFGLFVFNSYNLTAPGQPQYVNGAEVTPELANGLGVRPVIGRWFSSATEPSVVLSHALWTRLGADAAIAGKAVTLNHRSYTVAGVMGPGFNLPLAGPYGETQIQIWLPLDPLGPGRPRDAGVAFCYARLRPGATLAQASQEVKRAAAQIAARDPASHPGFTARVDNLHELLTKDLRPVLLLLFGAAGLLLLITCANVGGLLVSRAVSRARETAMRVALGAGVRQLAAQYFGDGLFLAALAAIGGIAITFAVHRTAIAFAGEHNVRIADARVDWRVVAFAFAVALGAVLLASMAPLWQAVRMQPNEVLSDGIRASAGVRTRRLSRSLVVSEIALACVLLALSTVFASEIFRLRRVSPGFDANDLLTFKLTLDSGNAPRKAARPEYEKRFIEALQQIPGVAAAGFGMQLPLEGCCFSTTIYPEGAAADPRAPDRVSFQASSPGFIAALKVPLRRGRLLDSRDHAPSNGPVPVVISESAAKRYWPNLDPVGQIGHFSSPTGSPFLVVGVVGDVKNNGLDNNPVPDVYLPSDALEMNPLNFVVRSGLPARALVPQVARAIQSVNPEQPIYSVETMSKIISDSLILKRGAAYVMTFFAFAALLMATIGAYGIVSYSVRQRTVEFGTRMALGALPGDVLRLVVGSGLKMAGWGVAIGGAAAIAAAWWLVRNFAMNIGNGGTGRIENPGAVPFLVSAVLLTAVVAASASVPAWWATRLSPMVAIRNEPGARASRSVVRVGAEDSAGSDPALVPELIEASRRASSPREALAAAMEAVRERVGASRVWLLERGPGGEYRAAAGENAPSISGGGLLANRLSSYSGPLPITRDDVDAWRRWAAESAAQYLPEVEAISDADVRIAVPLRSRSDVFALLLVGAPVEREKYGPAALRLLRGCADQFALLLENTRLTDRVLEQEKLRRDLALAADVQRRLLARQSLENDCVSIAAMSIPARSVGGDYFDLLELGPGRTGIAVADVAGKGVPAALIMSAVQATLRVLVADPSMSLAELAGRMNYFLHRSTGPSSYATFFYAVVDEGEGKLRYVTAGHNPPYLLHVNSGAGTIEELSVGGTVVGLFPIARYEEGSVDVRSGDVLMITTDGVPDALNPREEEYGEDRTRALLERIAPLPVEQMIPAVADELKAWIQDAEQFDDLTFVLMKVK